MDESGAALGKRGAMLINNVSDVTGDAQKWYDKVMLTRSLPKLSHRPFCQIRPIPRNEGTMAQFRGFNSLPIAGRLADDGLTPTGKKPSTQTIYAELIGHGDLLIYTDLLSYTTRDPLLSEFAELLGEQQGLTLDSEIRDEMASGTNVRKSLRCWGLTDSKRAITNADVEASVRMLEGEDIPKVTRMVSPTESCQAKPVPASYYALSHSHNRQNITALTGFVRFEEYASHAEDLPGDMEEIGMISPVRFVLTTNAKVFESAGLTGAAAAGMVTSGSDLTDVYTTIVLSQNAMGNIPLQKGSFSSIVKKLSSGGVENGLNRRGSMGGIAYDANKILNEAGIIRIEHAVKAL